MGLGAVSPYGRWFVYGGNWGWWPGPVYGGYEPVWAPAYVSFFGFGGGGWGVGFGFGVGFDSVGWLPCGIRGTASTHGTAAASIA